MKCQYCEKPATFHITELTEPDGPTVLHLCEDHARNFLHKDSPTPASSIAGAIAKQFNLGQTKEDLAQLDQKECPVCGISFFEFRSTGRLGCPYDYKHFQSDLDPLLRNIHDSLRHVGKRPQRAASSADAQAEMIGLRREMEQAVEKEDYDGPPKFAIRFCKWKPPRKRSSLPRRPRKTTRINNTKPADTTMKRDADLTQLVANPGQWLAGTGPESDIVISSRIRLARNLAEFPFVKRCSEEDLANIKRTLQSRMDQIEYWNSIHYVELDNLSEIDRQLLVERQLISRELADGEGSRAVAIDPAEGYSVMINEEDHLRIQVMQSGLDLTKAWKRINAIDDQLESAVLYAYHPTYGYLTACPTNVGTGLRVSVMLHLPALVITQQIEKVFRSMQRINVTVRGLYGEGSQYTGDFYQVSNQVTLGHSEQDLVELVGSKVVPDIIDYERKAREFLLGESEQTLHDQVSRALGILLTAKKISSEETMHYLSKLRMGVNLGLIDDVQVKTINKLFIHTQPAHLQKLEGRLLGSSDRNVQRANYLQRHLQQTGDGSLN